MRTQHHFVRVLGVPTHVTTHGGEGPTVLLLHGGICDNSELSWRAILPSLGGSCRVIAVDLPGFGKTPKPRNTETTIDYYTEFVAALMDSMGLDRAIVAGISMGGMIALSLYFEHPELVEKLVLINSAGLDHKFPLRKLGFFLTRIPPLYEWLMTRLANDRGTVKGIVGIMVHDKNKVTRRLIDKTHDSFLTHSTVKAFASFVQDQLRYNGMKTNFINSLPKISIPVTIIASDRDCFYPMSIMKRAVKKLRFGTLRVLKDCGHWATVERPDLVASIILESI